MAASPQLDATNHVLIYDGDCGFCTTTAKKILEISSGLSIAPWQSFELSKIGLTEQEASQKVHLYDGEKVYAGHLAIAKALTYCNSSALKLLGKIGQVLPASWIAKALYPIIARFRHKLPGSTDACRLD